MLNLQIDYFTDWLGGAPFVNGSANNFSTVPILPHSQVFVRRLSFFLQKGANVWRWGEQICICDIGLHADQFRNKVYSYGANLFFTRHKPDTSLALSHFGIF